MASYRRTIGRNNLRSPRCNLVPMRAIVSLLVCSVFSTACVGQIPTQNEWGEKFNSPGASLVLKESGRDRSSGRTVVTYSLFASGMPKDEDYTLWIRLVGENPKAATDAFINEEGRVVNVLSDPVRKIDEDAINIQAVAGRGEPKQFALISNDGKYRAFGQAIPFPIENAVGSCRISAIMLAARYSVVQIIVTGLLPKEELQVEVTSGGEGKQS